ncbi:hypothetical protein H3C67_05125 [Candidatus Dojkabacteria bacterium]|uniref:Yip1 domain-containing protein n=1 Tax=Candidatus Dojkabacteria bacterium TaxID=2099670 RepID=A0A952DSC5_9BACT|nr:hypothetical protein [Candidatus Dojkabacteria bacterium]
MQILRELDKKAGLLLFNPNSFQKRVSGVNNKKLMLWSALVFVVSILMYIPAELLISSGSAQYSVGVLNAMAYGLGVAVLYILLNLIVLLFFFVVGRIYKLKLSLVKTIKGLLPVIVTAFLIDRILFVIIIFLVENIASLNFNSLYIIALLAVPLWQSLHFIETIRKQNTLTEKASTILTITYFIVIYSLLS